MVEQYGSRVNGRVERSWKQYSSAPSIETVAYAAALTDVVLILVTLATAYVAFSQSGITDIDQVSLYAGAGLLFAAIFVMLLFARGAYSPVELTRIRKQLSRVVIYGSGLTALFTFVGFLMKINAEFSRATIGLFLVLCPLSLMVARLFWAEWIPIATARGTFSPRRLLLICRHDYAVADLRERLADSGAVVAHVIHMPRDVDTASWIQGMNAHVANSADEILLVADSADIMVVRALLDEMRSLPMPVRLALDPTMASIAACPVSKIGKVSTFEVQRMPLSRLERSMKRSFDIVFSLVAIFVLLPVYLVAAMAIMFDDRGPVLFRQRRLGYNNVSFRIAKFRTMTVLEDSGEIVQAKRDDSRLTRIGGFLRSSSIDELPQFWNVLTGHMSVVGPRPHAVVHDDRYDQLIARYAFRRHVKPGITGWAQINGLRGETPTIDSMEARVAHDLWYIHNWSLWLDLKIVLMTCVSVLDRSRTY